MNMTLIDWSIVLAVFVFITYVALRTQKYTKSVSDFLAANRCAGRYLLAMAEGEAAMGAVSVIVLFEVWQQTGFTQQFWYSAVIPIGLIMTLTGFVYYRYRQTRAMTLAQFFEMRYSKKFRIFSGLLSWVSGVINYGLMPVVEARFFMNFCGFTSYVIPVGPFQIDLTLASIMLVLIGLGLYFTFCGGQISVLVTNFWQALFAMTVFVVTIAFLWHQFPWSKMSEALVIASEPGKSLINPLDISNKKDFGLSFFFIYMFMSVYNRMAWQGTQGYNCAAITPHEAKMSKVVGGLKGAMITLGLTLMPLAAITYLYHPEFTLKAAAVNQELSNLYPSDTILQTQMRVPLVLSHILPVGLIGAFTAAMIGFAVSTHSTYIHSWGSILIQDVICPLRKNPLSQRRHMFYLRTSIIAVAVFAFIFGLIFPLQEYIYMFFQITGAIYLGGAGSAIIGGLYWKRGTATAAWVSMIAGSVVAASTIVLRIVWADIPFLVERWGSVFPMNSQVMSFFAALIGIGCYVIISLLSKDPNVNMDRLLHRGKYALKEEEDEIKARVKKEEKAGRFWRFIGVNSHEFSKVDKGLFLYTFCMSMYGILGFAVTLILGLIGWMTDQRWLIWWLISLIVWLAIGTIGVIWVGIGGLVDLKKMYHRLATIKENVVDDGRVQGDHLLADETQEKVDLS